MIETINVSELTVGMFIADLDRPWVETPFALQGFVIENEGEIAELRRFCRAVMIDRARSTGEAYKADPIEPKPAEIKRTVVGPAYVHVYQEPKAAAPVERQGLVSSLKQVVRETVAAQPDVPRSNLPPPSAALGKVRILDDGGGLDAKGQAQLAQYQANKASTQLSNVIAQDRVNAPQLSEQERALMGELKEAGGFDYAKFTAKAYTGEAAKSDTAKALEKARGGGLVDGLKSLFGKKATEDAEDEGIRVYANQAAKPVYEDKTSLEEELPAAREVHNRAERMVQTVLTDIRANKVPEMGRVQEAVGYMVESVVRNPDALLWLSRLKSEDAYTYEHGLNCSIYMMAFGRHMGLGSDSLQVLGTAGLMQDVGKIRLPHDLIERQGDLDWDEFERIKSHVTHSIDILNESSSTSPLVLDVVNQHHERLDGSGYPQGLSGDHIWQLGGMAGIVDVYTALTTLRPYSGPISSQEALRKLYDWRATYFDENLIEQFIQCVGIYPVGSLVELNTGEIAVVVSQNRQRRLKPRVMLILDEAKQSYGRPRMIDLMLDPLTQTGTMYTISQALSADAYDMSAAAESVVGIR